MSIKPTPRIQDEGGHHALELITFFKLRSSSRVQLEVLTTWTGYAVDAVDSEKLTRNNKLLVQLLNSRSTPCVALMCSDSRVCWVSEQRDLLGKDRDGALLARTRDA
jgi:hypothetical protein